MKNNIIDTLLFTFYGKRRSRTLAEDTYHDIIKLWKARVVIVKAKGKSITEIYVDVKSRLDKPLRIVIPHGTRFNAQGSHQNMVIRKEIVFILDPYGSRFLNAPVSCINAERPIPGKADSFKGVKRVSPSLERFLRHSEGYSPMVTQAGLWALTDGYDRRQIKDRLVYVSDRGIQKEGIADSEIDCAKGILDRLEIHSNLN